MGVPDNFILIFDFIKLKVITMIERLIYRALVLLTFNTGIIYAQIGGISNSKVVVPGTETVGVGVFEFEPAFEVFSPKSEWDSNSNLVTFDSSSTESSYGFRFTTGVKENLEVGMIIPSDMSSLNFGLKWLFWSRKDLSVALQSGLNFDALDESRYKDEGIAKIFGYGLVLTYEPEDKISIDSDISLSFYTAEVEGQSVGHSGTFDIGVSYGFLKNFHSVAEYNFNWITFENRDLDSKIGSGLLGFTFGASPSTLVIMGFLYDVHSTNNPKGVAYIAAFTFLI